MNLKINLVYFFSIKHNDFAIEMTVYCYSFTGSPKFLGNFNCKCVRSEFTMKNVNHFKQDVHKRLWINVWCN